MNVPVTGYLARKSKTEVIIVEATQMIRRMSLYNASAMVISCAFVQIYFPDGVLLFFSSRLIVASLVPTMLAISFLFVFFWSKAKICDLYSEVN